MSARESESMPPRPGPSVVDVSAADKTAVMLGLLQTNREEIREWQKSLFEASFWFNAGILGIAAFIHGGANKPALLVLLAGMGMACLAGFFVVFSGVARRAIELSGEDLLKFQRALRLDERGCYLDDESIYPATRKWLPQTHVIWLRALTIAVCLSAILSILIQAQR